MTISSSSGADNLTVINAIVRILNKNDTIIGQPRYIGTELIETQKKLLYDSSSFKSYILEDEFILPVTTFSVSLKTSLPPGKIRYNKRVEHFENINLWSENFDEKVEKRCQFSLRGTDFVSIVDDIMMRLEIKDEGFCIEISRLTITNLTASNKIT